MSILGSDPFLPFCLLFIADAHRDDGKRFVVRADEKLTAFLELESVIRQFIARIRQLTARICGDCS